MQVHLYGAKLEDGQAVRSVDHVVQKFEVIIRAMRGVGPQDLKDLIQRKYEVASLKEIDRTDYVI